MVCIIMKERVYQAGANYLKGEEYEVSPEVATALGDSIEVIGSGVKTREIKKAKNAAITPDEAATKDEATEETNETVN